MLVKQIVKGADGDYEFSANVTQEEFDFIFGVGINYLLQEGAMSQEDYIEGEEYDDEIEGSYVDPKDLN